MYSFKYIIVAFICLSVGVSVCESVVHEIKVNPKLTLTYEIKGSKIEFKCHVKWKWIWPKVWCKIGFSYEFGSKQSSNVIDTDWLIGAVTNVTMSTCGDYHVAVNTEIMQLDESQDLECFNSEPENEHNVTTIKISRNLITNDIYDHPIGNETVNVMWAFNDENDDITSEPTASGTYQINFEKEADGGTSTTSLATSTLLLVS